MREAEDIDGRDVDVPIVFQGLRPVTPPGSIERSIWYQSGYQAGHRRLNLWRGATISLALGMAALLGEQQISHHSTPVDHIVVVKAPEAPKTQPLIETPPLGSGSYARLLIELTQDDPHAWAERDLPAGNPYGPPPQSSTELMKLNLPPFN